VFHGHKSAAVIITLDILDRNCSWQLNAFGDKRRARRIAKRKRNRDGPSLEAVLLWSQPRAIQGKVWVVAADDSSVSMRVRCLEKSCHS
jgi:hypothetical protein